MRPDIAGMRVAPFVSFRSRFHRYTPAHLINYPAIALALKSKGVKRVLSFASVGSLNPEVIRPGDVVLIGM